MKKSPQHCRWHSAYVDSGLFNWCCEEACVLDNWQQGEELLNCPLDKQMTLRHVIEEIGVMNWELIKDCPEDVFQCLRQQTAQHQEPQIPVLQQSTSCRIDIDGALCGTGKGKDQQSLYTGVNGSDPASVLIMNTLLSAVRDLDLEPERYEAVEAMMVQIAPTDSASAMQFAVLAINYFHFQLIGKLGTDAVDIQLRIKLLRQLTQQFNQQFEGLQKYLKQMSPQVRVSVEQLFSQKLN